MNNSSKASASTWRATPITFSAELCQAQLVVGLLSGKIIPLVKLPEVSMWIMCFSTSRNPGLMTYATYPNVEFSVGSHIPYIKEHSTHGHDILEGAHTGRVFSNCQSQVSHGAKSYQGYLVRAVPCHFSNDLPSWLGSKGGTEGRGMQ